MSQGGLGDDQYALGSRRAASGVMVGRMTPRRRPIALPSLIAIPALLVLSIAATPAATAALPAGPAKPALAFPHFPDRLHAFIWRNWGLVPADRLAAVLGTTADNVRALNRRPRF